MDTARCPPLFDTDAHGHRWGRGCHAALCHHRGLLTTGAMKAEVALSLSREPGGLSMMMAGGRHGGPPDRALTSSEILAATSSSAAQTP